MTPFFLDIEEMDDLFSHPIYGASYEGYVVENILTALPKWRGYFYRTSNGAEIDLVLERGQRTIAIEIKSSSSPKPSKGFWSARDDINPTQTFIIAPVNEPYPIADKTEVLPLDQFFIRMTGEKGLGN